MRWKQGRRSDNIEDMRSASSSSMGAMGGVSAIARILPFLLRTKTGRTLLIIGVLVYFGAKFMGFDLLQLAAPPASMDTSSQQLSPKDQEMAEFVSVVLADTESTWHLEFKKLG